MIEEHESDIEDWYFHHQDDIRLSKYLCGDRVLKKGDAGCLTENLLPDTSKESKTPKSEL